MRQNHGLGLPKSNHWPEWIGWLLHHGTRDEVIDWLCWCDPNGVWTDADSKAEGMQPLSLEAARAKVAEMIEDYNS